MSLMRQLWLMVLVSTILAFAGSLFISIWSAKDYLTQQLQRKNSDNANSLALAMTQQEKDAVMVDLQVAALFDTGYYQKVSVVDPRGKVIAERIQDKSDVAVPAWFMDMFPIKSVPGVAQISDGWKQYGVVTVISHSQFAHRALWEQAGRLSAWFAAGGAVLGLLGMLILRVIGRSLNDVVTQATAIGERRFITIPEPRPLELKSVTRAMNGMVERLKSMFSEEAARLETLRQKVNRDTVTGLSSRDYFLAHLREVINGEQFGATGSLVLVRLLDIAQLNAKLGHRRTDELLAALGAVLYESGNNRDGQRAGRLKGNEFGILCPTFDNPASAAQDIHERLTRDWLPGWSGEFPDLFHIAAVQYHRNQNIGALMAQLDEVLAKAISLGANSWHAADQSKPAELSVPAEQWRTLLTEAVSGGQLSLAFYPVVRGDGSLPLHEEGVIRLQTSERSSSLSAGDFMPMAAKLNLTAPLDLGVVKLAIEHLQKGSGKIAVNLSAETIADFGFRNQLLLLLKNYPEICRRLLFEVPEYGAFRQFDAFCELARVLKSLGCKVGIEYFGQRFAESHKLASLGLDYIKVHPSYIRDIASNPGNQEFLQGLCRMAHGLGIEVIALGVESIDDLPLLGSLGFDGATGPGVR